MTGWTFPYASQRMPVLAANVVATSQPLATAAGLAALRAGGNAIDAALAAAITLTVVEPTANGIGSDAFALVHHQGAVHALNASGRAPAAWTPERFAGRAGMPADGPDSITVPGAVSAWVALSKRFGRLPFARLFADAIRYAEEGFLVGPMTAAAWAASLRALGRFPDWLATFAPGGRAPAAGERFRCPAQAATLRAIAASDGDDFYRGDLARRIAAAAGAMTVEDLAAHRADWVEPLGLPFAGHVVHELPPNGQGLAAQLALGIAAHLGLGEHAPDSATSVHLQVEAMKLAFSDIHRHLGDADAMRVAPARLLDPAYHRARAALVDRRQAGTPASGVPDVGGTVYLACADAAGTQVSYIQSNYAGFGSGVVVPGTGIALQNRGLGFTLEPGHPNRVGPRKRPFHTIIPGLLTHGGAATAAFGVMGGPMQAQGHVQLVLRTLLHGQNPQAAIDAPRWQVMESGALLIEPGFPAATKAGLAALGHQLGEAPASRFGGAQWVSRLEHGHLAASDPRKEGQAAGW